MDATLADLPEIRDCHAFNAERWDELFDDPLVASLDRQIETDRFGHVIMMPRPGFGQSRLQGRIVKLLDHLMEGEGETQPECPVSTTQGVKGVDAVWVSDDLARRALRGSLLVEAPEICIEILSPKNTRSEIDEKQRLYFEAGATEVWICDGSGSMTFFSKDGEMNASTECPEFPERVDLGL